MARVEAPILQLKQSADNIEEEEVVYLKFLIEKHERGFAVLEYAYDIKISSSRAFLRA